NGTGSWGGSGGGTGNRQVGIPAHTLYYGNAGDGGLPARAGGWGGSASYIDPTAGTLEDCTDRDARAPGTTGAAGRSGAGFLGYFDASVWIGAPGAPGSFGEIGQGGGGGGGAAVVGAGISGGGGGCGGCGGGRGRGGLAGGSSFALVSLRAEVLLDGCALAS